MGQIVENIKVANDGKPNSLSERELSIIAQVKEAYRKMLKIDCTGCAYCMPCETGVNIPLNFSLYNDMFMFKNPEVNVFLYNELISPEQRRRLASNVENVRNNVPSIFRSRMMLSRSRILITTLSPKSVGIVETRKSISFPSDSMSTTCPPIIPEMPAACATS
jgi:hypothetical protein